MVRAASSSSPSVKHISPDHPVKLESVRPHAQLAAGVSVCAWYDPLRPAGSAWDPAGAQPGVERPPRNRERPRHQRVRLIRFDIDMDVWRSYRAGGGTGAVDATTHFGVLQELVLRSQTTFVTAAAAELLARREHSAAELRRKLRRKGFTAAACDHALTRLQERSLQDDRRFAEAWLRSRMRGRGQGRAALQAGLAERGIPRELAQEVIREYEDEHPDAFSAALAANLRRMGHAPGDDPSDLSGLSRRERDRLLQRLLRRGFAWDELRDLFA